MKPLSLVACALVLAGCTTIKPFGSDGTYVAAAWLGPADAVPKADAFCNAQGKVLVQEDLTPTRLLFHCRAPE